MPLMRPLARVPWDVPVRLVTTPSPAGRPLHRSVALGVALDGVVAVDVVTVRGDGPGPDVLTDVRPVRPGTADTADAGRAAGPGSGPDGTFAELLADLAIDGAVPVAVDGTPFTHDVLAALARIPVGARRTYADLAADAGRPRAVRAVASVMARNRVPLVLPCHRVVPSGGGTGRYGWGDATKVALLALESDA